MRIRGQRECQDCGTRWSYYETGDVACPECDSLRSVGVDERARHTDAPISLDLTAARGRVDTDGTLAAVEAAAEDCREYVRRTGFINAGTLKPLSETYLAAIELSYVARIATRSLVLDDDAEFYLLSLLRGADLDDRPAPDEVPDALRGPRNLAYATAIDDYRRDVRAYLDDAPDPAAGRALGRLVDHVRRIEALDGELDVRTTERLVLAAREIGEYVIDGDETALATAISRLDDLADAA